MSKKWYKSKIVQIKEEAPNVKRFWLEVEDTKSIDFIAGQFITLDLPISDKRTKRWRSYSIANAPTNDNLLELCVVKSANGLGSAYLFEEAEIGTSIRFKGPLGVFTLPKVIEKDIVLICTGTGVVPFRSMLWDIIFHKKQHKNIHLIFGTRRSENILYRNEFDEWKQKIKGFHYSIALSREPFDGYKGYVHPVYRNDYKKLRPDVQFYICGWRNMVDEAVATLKNMGYDSSQIRIELYG